MKEVINVALAGILLAVVIACVILSIHWVGGLLPNPAIISLLAAVALLVVAIMMIVNWREL